MIVLIPSSKLIPVEMQADFGAIPSALVPIDRQPAIRRLMSGYPRDATFCIAAHEEIGQIMSYLDSDSSISRYSIIDVGNTRTLGETICKAILHMKTTVGGLVVHFADTVLGDFVTPIGDYVCYSEVEDLYRWTAFETDESLKISAIFDKNTTKTDMEFGKVFVGVFGISNPSRFLLVLQRHLDSETEIDPFFTALQEYFNSSETRRVVKVDQWFDFGHLDTYYESRRLLNRHCRSFNSLTIDTVRGVIRKESLNHGKFVGEINWYLNLPSSLKYLGPRIFEYSTDPVFPWVEMEYYGYPTLDDIFLFGQLNLGTWSRIFSAIKTVLMDMSSHVQILNPVQLATSMEAIYLRKTLERVYAYIDLRDFKLFRDPFFCNGHRVMGLDQVIGLLPSVLSEYRILEKDKFTVIHGDLCCSNILFDRRNCIVRLIDPRGEFGMTGIYGDNRYDHCKLSHSFCGDYDFILSGLFTLNESESGIEFLIKRNNEQEEIRKLFRRIFFQSGFMDYKITRLLESLLFLSMIPLHSDRPLSQRAFLIQGLKIFTEITGR